MLKEMIEQTNLSLLSPSLSSLMMSEWKGLVSLCFSVSLFRARALSLSFLSMYACECVLARTAVIMRMRARGHIRIRAVVVIACSNRI